MSEAVKREPFYNRIEFAIIVCFFTIMVVITAFTVFSRYFFAFTFSWAEQLTRLLFVYVSFAGVSWAGRLGAHMRVSAVTLFLGEKRGKYVFWFGDGIAVIVALYLAFHIAGIMMIVYERGQVFSAMPWMPVWVMYLAGVLGMLGFCCRVVQGRVIEIRTLFKNKEN
ncbi:MAG: TRAP transporter small permease subunit [Treponema sp.]|nr:TRAP transporter small permease subunit [Treponema sp.]